MIINPMIPIWLISIICIVLLFLKRRKPIAYLRQIVIIILLFTINLRIMIPGEEVKAKEQGLNVHVLFVIDNTISMLARDYNGEEERAQGVREHCEYIIDKLYGAKFGAISFDNSANVLLPFTDSAEQVKSAINGIYPIESRFATGTTLDTPKETIIERIKDCKKNGAENIVLFFISDGEITVEDASLGSYKEVGKLIDNGAVLGYGTDKGGKMYMEIPYMDEIEEIEATYDEGPAISKIDEVNLKKIAKDMGIAYVNMNDYKDIDDTIEDILRDAKVEDQDEELLQTTYNVAAATDLYYYFVVPLLLLLVFEGFVLIKDK